MNTKQHHVLLNVLTGMNQTDAYENVYGPNPNSRFLASQLLTTPHIKAELERLKQRKAEIVLANEVNNIATLDERQEILTEIARSEYQIEEESERSEGKRVTRVKRRDPVAAIQELNKMDGSYAPSKHLIGQRIQFEVVYKEKEGSQDATE